MVSLGHSKHPFWLTIVHRSMGGVIAADIATYYGINLVRGVIMMGSFPHRNMLDSVSTSWASNFIPRVLDPSLAAFGPTAKEFVESLSVLGDQLDQGTKYSWIGALATQNPDSRNWLLPHPQNETALMDAAKSFPYLVLHGAADKLIDGNNLKEWMSPRFGNFAYRLWDNTGHAPFWDNPDQVNLEIVTFANRLSSVALPFL